MSAVNLAATRPVPAPPPVTLRLTRRGRVVLLGIPAVAAAMVVALVAAALLVGLFANEAHASTAPVEEVRTAAVTVLAGDSLWTVARRSDPRRDPRDVISDIVALNELHRGVVHPGQQLVVPLRR
ncbi:LysM peptidoglycan-binding domain-containing protein [Specibacter cremeus]|uniref:LysM peptidoglycan-binding domain-containing protein n=1 Tax=Specibacter cremeus TaxID=1629051 RepID=UPI000F768538|nr:LysM peptidoglycan-binding domain-containing protein [Specibacter cremeus]